MTRLCKFGALTLILIFIFPVICPGQDSESSSSVNSGLFFGAGLGKGSLNIRFSGDIEDRFTEDGLAFTYRFGYALNDMIHLGLDMDLLLYYRHSKFKTFAGYSFVLNYYINNILFVKAGPSLSLIEGEPTGSEESEGTFGFTLGAGLDIRIFDRFAFTPVYCYYHNASSTISTNYHVFAVGATYYFK